MTASPAIPAYVDRLSAKNITVHENFLPEPLYRFLYDRLDAEPMNYGSLSSRRNDPHGHWVRMLMRAGTTYNLADLTEPMRHISGYENLYEAWARIRDACIPGSLLVRCYANGYTYGTDGYFHRDSQREDEFTAVLYMNDEWNPNWAGETVFLDDAGDIQKAVLPKRNRLVVFPSDIKHAGRGVSRQCMVLRKVLVFKARMPRNDTFEGLSAFLIAHRATELRHQKGSLHDHLLRTYDRLERRGIDLQICLGGGLHSIYGTNAFVTSLLKPDMRGEVAATFGAYAEQLAYLFCSLNRPYTLVSPVELSELHAVVQGRNGENLRIERKVFDDLRLIECANQADQTALDKHDVLKQIWAGYPCEKDVYLDPE